MRSTKGSVYGVSGTRIPVRGRLQLDESLELSSESGGSVSEPNLLAAWYRCIHRSEAPL